MCDLSTKRMWLNAFVFLIVEQKSSGKVKHRFRVQIYELQIQIHESRVHIPELRVQFHELRV